jgi:hypothetical protein
MPLRTRQPTQLPSQPPVYEIVLASGNGADPRLRVFAGDADQATVSFHTMLARLRQSQERGELRLCELRDEKRVILRAPLVEAETSQ